MEDSEADRFGVILQAADRVVRLIVEDNRGFDMAHCADEMAPGLQHLGLLGLRERLALVGCSLEVVSSAQQGRIAVYVYIPL